MEEKLKEKLWAFIVQNNPDLMFNLQEGYSVMRYLEEKINQVKPTMDRLLAGKRPLYVIEELCMNEMTEELKPSRFLYVRQVVEEEFPEDFKRLTEDGLLTYEVINMMEACREVFETFDFCLGNEHDRRLRHAIIALVHNHLI